MNEPHDNHYNLSRWHRRYLNGFWWSLLFVFLAQCASLLTTEKEPAEFALRFIALPTVMLAGLLGVAEALLRTIPRYHEYVFTTLSALLSGVLVVVHATLDFIQALWLIPILYSIVYFQRRFIFIAWALSAGMMVALTALHAPLRTHTSGTEWIAMFAFLCAATWIALRVMERGRELMEHLKEETRNKERFLLLSRTDALTQLFNHISYHERIDDSFAAMAKEPFPLHLALLDIDDFKSINDTFGHRTGDLVLQRVASVIKAGVGPDDAAFRYGGEEFAVVLIRKDEEAAYRIMEGIREAVCRIVHRELNGHEVTVSIGLQTHVPGDTKETLFEQADEKLYAAKKTGKNRTVRIAASGGDWAAG
ncbi:GGDEF domain-containing protein [Paenibacillus sp. TRM 82003]|nr:GGDEF domain-containing protein [Paenibacillus sp. TRM 82003]